MTKRLRTMTDALIRFKGESKTLDRIIDILTEQTAVAERHDEMLKTLLAKGRTNGQTK